MAETAWGPGDLADAGSLAAKFAPLAGPGLKAAYPEIRARLIEAHGPVKGRLAFAAVRSGMERLSAPGPLAVVVRVVVEMALGILFPFLAPFFPLINSFLDRVNAAPPADAPAFPAYLAALAGLLRTPPQSLSLPARVGLGLTPPQPEDLTMSTPPPSPAVRAAVQAHFDAALTDEQKAAIPLANVVAGVSLLVTLAPTIAADLAPVLPAFRAALAHAAPVLALFKAAPAPSPAPPNSSLQP